VRAEAIRRASRAKPVRANATLQGRHGFTLVELLVALAIGVFVVVGARALLDGLAAQATRVAAATRETDADANGERLLRALVGHLEIPAEVGSTSTFGGDERSVHFSSWCEMPRGWQERCRVRLDVEHTPDGIAVVAGLSTGETLALKHGQHTEGFRYLVNAGLGGSWVYRWGDGLSAPLAIGILIDGDTMIVRIGERG
jgi:prepilin-type N-terminal cleavage/methylation domain-containing protein